jgi:hypothetical protein
MIGQRLCKQVSLCDCVFIAGWVPSHCLRMVLTAVIRRDAFHTIGQGMNVYVRTFLSIFLKTDRQHITR